MGVLWCWFKAMLAPNEEEKRILDAIAKLPPSAEIVGRGTLVMNPKRENNMGVDDRTKELEKTMKTILGDDTVYERVVYHLGYRCEFYKDKKYEFPIKSTVSIIGVSDNGESLSISLEDEYTIDNHFHLNQLCMEWAGGFRDYWKNYSIIDVRIILNGV